MIKNILYVGLGGFLGSVFRYLIGYVIADMTEKIPSGIIVANVVGCFIIGVLAQFFVQNVNVNETLKLFLMVGFCGGLTTFSSFSLESISFLKMGETLIFVLYVSITFILCLLSTLFGMYLVKNVF